MPKFEVFTKRLVPLKKTPLVTIQKRGTISLNQSAHAALGSPKAVELLYDRDEHMIGLRAVDQTLEHAYPVRSSTNRDSGPYVISAIAFLRFYDLNMADSRRWDAPIVDDVLCIDLTQPGTVVSSNRALRSPTADLDE